MSEASATVPRPRAYYTEPQWIDVMGLDVAYRREGQGEPTLFLHGADFTRMWLPFHERLAGAVDLIAPEHPGYGETPMPDWLDGFDDLVVHYDALLDAFEIERAHVVGYSLGGWIAAELAVFCPRRLRSLTLITPPGLRVEGKPIEDFFQQPPEALFARIFEEPERFSDVIPDFEDFDEVVHRYGEATAVARIAWEVQYDLKLERRLQRVQCPSLVVRAEHDRLVPDEIAERYAELLPEGRIETVPGTGHGLILEEPDATADLIARFVQGATG